MSDDLGNLEDEVARRLGLGGGVLKIVQRDLERTEWLRLHPAPVPQEGGHPYRGGMDRPQKPKRFLKRFGFCYRAFKPS